MIAEKFIRKYRKRDQFENKEILVREYDFMNCEIDMELILYFADYWDDPEECYAKGLTIDWDGDVHSIDVNEFIVAIGTYKEHNEDAESMIHKADKAIKMVEPYKGFNIYPGREI